MPSTLTISLALSDLSVARITDHALRTFHFLKRILVWITAIGTNWGTTTCLVHIFSNKGKELQNSLPLF